MCGGWGWRFFRDLMNRGSAAAAPVVGLLAVLLLRRPHIQAEIPRECLSEEASVPSRVDAESGGPSCSVRPCECEIDERTIPSST